MDPTFHYLIMAEHAMIQKELLLRLKGTGLTLGQPKVLDYLREHNGASQKEIAGGCHIEAGSLTSILNRMEDKGIVERRMLNGNRRNFHIFLTERGRELLHLVTENFNLLEEKAFLHIPDDQKESFMQTLKQIYANLTLQEDKK